jgi:hypothetical protein
MGWRWDGMGCITMGAWICGYVDFCRVGVVLLYNGFFLYIVRRCGFFGVLLVPRDSVELDEYFPLAFQALILGW